MLVHTDLVEVVGRDVVDVHLRVLVWLLVVPHWLLPLVVVVVLLLLKRFLALATLRALWVRHDTLGLRNRLEGHPTGSGTFTIHLLIVVRLRLGKLKVAAWMTRCLRVAAGERTVLCTSKVRVPLW